MEQSELVFGRCRWIRRPPYVAMFRHMNDGTWRVRVLSIIEDRILSIHLGLATLPMAEVWANAKLDELTPES